MHHPITNIEILAGGWLGIYRLDQAIPTIIYVGDVKTDCPLKGRHLMNLSLKLQQRKYEIERALT